MQLIKKICLGFACLLYAGILTNVHGSTSATDTVPASPVLLKLNLIEGGTVKGYVIDITDSSVLVVPKNKWKNGFYDTAIIIAAENIKVISGRKKGTLSKLGGAVGGLVVGSAIGLGIAYKSWENSLSPLDNRDFFSSDEWKVGRYAGPVLGGGGLIAGFFSEGKHKKKRFKIKGNRLNLKYKRFEILSE